MWVWKRYENSFKKFLLCGKCFDTMGSTASWHPPVLLPRLWVCGPTSNYPTVRHRPPGGSQQRWNVLIFSMIHLEYVQQKQAAAAPGLLPWWADAGCRQTLETKTAFMKEARFLSWSRRFLEHTQVTHLFFSSSSPFIFSFHHSIIYFSSSVHSLQGEIKPNLWFIHSLYLWSGWVTTLLAKTSIYPSLIVLTETFIWIL